MKKIMNIFAAALVMLSAVGCEKNETLPDVPSTGKITLSATISNGGTKTSLGEWNSTDNEYPVLWSQGDAIAVINNGKLFKFVVDAEDAGKTQGTFTLDETALQTGSTPSDFKPEMAIQAFYPYDGVTYSTGGTNTITYTVPATQTYQVSTVDEEVCSSFGKGAMPMAGYAANSSGVITFENLFGVVKLQLKGVAEEKVKSIEISSSENLSGSSGLTISESNKSIFLSSSDAAAKKVVLDCGTEGVALNAETVTDFLVALSAGATGLKVLVNTTEASYYKEVPAQDSESQLINSVVAGTILKMPELNTVDMAPAYIENGVYYGDGIALPKSADGSETLIWAPVNCGYEPANGEYKGYPYGKLYQWGRKYGQGYNTDYDVTAPTVEQGPVALEVGQNPDNANKFYKNDSSSPYNWVSSQNGTLWNSGTEEAPVKTEYDPCPEGWRVPTNTELLSLLDGLTEGGSKSGLSSQWTNDSNDSNHNGIKGFWFYGNTTATTGNKVFFPAAGYRYYYIGSAYNRGIQGSYWSSSVDDNYAWTLHFKNNGTVSSSNLSRAYGVSVRCVKD